MGATDHALWHHYNTYSYIFYAYPDGTWELISNDGLFRDVWQVGDRLLTEKEIQQFYS